MPITAPLMSLVTFWVSSAFARAISSRMRSCAFSVTSWTAWPSWEVSWSGAKGPQDFRQDKGCGERDPHLDLGAVAERQIGERVAGRCAVGLRGAGGWSLRSLRGGGCRPGLRAEPDAGGGDGGGGDA